MYNRRFANKLWQYFNKYGGPESTVSVDLKTLGYTKTPRNYQETIDYLLNWYHGCPKKIHNCRFCPQVNRCFPSGEIPNTDPQNYGFFENNGVFTFRFRQFV